MARNGMEMEKMEMRNEEGVLVGIGRIGGDCLGLVHSTSSETK